MSQTFLQDKRALVIDRDLNNLNIFDVVLPEFGYEIVITQSGGEAMKRLEEEEFHLTIVDLSVSQTPSLDFISKIHERAPDLPIVGVAASLTSRSRFFSGLMAAFLQKPFTDADVRATIDEILADPTKRLHHETTVIDSLELRNQNQQLKVLVEMAIALGEVAEFEKLMPLVVDLTCMALDVERGTVFMVDKEKNELWSRAGSGLEATEIRVSISSGIAGRVARTGRTVLTNDPYSNEDFNSEFDRKLGFTTRSILSVPVKNANGNIIGILQVLNKKSEDGFSAIDEKLLYGIASIAAVRLENSLLLGQIEQQKKLSMLGTLAGGISHEIKNLLSPLSFAELISAKYPEDEQVARYTQMIMDARDHAINLLEEVRDIAKPVRDYEVELMSLAEVVKEVTLFLSVDSLVKHIDLRLDLDEELPFVPLNRRKVKQVLINLIRNGCQALEDPNTGHISIRLQMEDEDIVLHVEDTGKGIPPEQIDKIWEPFFSTKGDSGTGLGLDICVKIVEALGGAISCTSEVGVGTDFTLRFPKECYEAVVSSEEELSGLESVEVIDLDDDDDEYDDDMEVMDEDEIAKLVDEET
jgi:two-component system NtrC family sensor kinase